jgi:dipeptidyl aminopeptidase/acylaminoacyl peptidase
VRRGQNKVKATMNKKSNLAGLLGLAALAVPALAAPRAFEPRDLILMNRITEMNVSPDGSRLVYTQRVTDLDGNRGRTDLWLVDKMGSAPPRQLTFDPAGDTSPRFAPDGKGVYFLSTRGGSSQVWYLPLEGGGESRQVTKLPLDVGAYLLSPDGKHLAVALEVFIDCPTLDCTKKRLDEPKKGSGQLYDRYFVRHWDTWADGRRNHIFVLPTAGAAGEPVDVASGLDGDAPSKPFGGMEEAAFTPDGKSVVFSARVDPTGEPLTTNFDLYVAPIDGSAKPRKITTNPAWDTRPIFSPDGKQLLHLAHARNGFEADRFEIMLRAWPDGTDRKVAPSWDRSPDDLVFSPDGKKLYVTATDLGNTSLFAIDVATGKETKLIAKGHVRHPEIHGSEIYYGFDTLKSPVDIFAIDVARPASPRRLTSVNAAVLAELGFGDFEQFEFAGWNDEKVYGYVVKPFGFEEGKKYPVAFLIHGGPQGSMQNDFHYRWNAQTYAGAGYAVVMIDFHGSTGYGQAFTDSISGDWGGKPLEDLQKGWAAARSRFAFLDGNRACALGASYGGYMINWIAGNWPDGPDSFRCLVNHDGLFNFEAMAYATEELWFSEWEFGGKPWQADLEKWNPVRHVDKWKTPMLVIHGGKDYRVVDTEGLSTFTALQLKGVPSQLLYFPDENHWVLKPQNSLQWHDTVFAWLKRYTAE